MSVEAENWVQNVVEIKFVFIVILTPAKQSKVKMFDGGEGERELDLEEKVETWKIKISLNFTHSWHAAFKLEFKL